MTKCQSHDFSEMDYKCIIIKTVNLSQTLLHEIFCQTVCNRRIVFVHVLMITNNPVEYIVIYGYVKPSFNSGIVFNRLHHREAMQGNEMEHLATNIHQNKV